MLQFTLPTILPARIFWTISDNNRTHVHGCSVEDCIRFRNSPTWMISVLPCFFNTSRSSSRVTRKSAPAVFAKASR